MPHWRPDQSFYPGAGLMFLPVIRGMASPAQGANCRMPSGGPQQMPRQPQPWCMVPGTSS